MYCNRCTSKRLCLSHTVMPIGQYADKTFDEIPLGYLDWLSGQDWLSYGTLRKRLTAYLTHPCIQRELDELFPEEWDDSRTPIFRVPFTQRREPMPKEFVPDLDEETREESTRFTPGSAWSFVADTIESLETITDPNDFLAINRTKLHQAVQLLGKMGAYTAIRTLREAYRTCRLRLQAIRSPYTLQELLAKLSPT